MTAHLQRLAETTTDPRTRAICFVLARGGDCDHAELVAFMAQGTGHPERVTTHLANLAGVLQLNTLGRVVCMPPDHWPETSLRRTRRVSSAGQQGLPTKDDLVDAMRTPPVAVETPPAVDRRFDRHSREESFSASTNDRSYLMTKLRRLPALEREICRPTTENHFRMARMFSELEQRDPEELKAFLADLADSTLARNPPAIANRWMTARLDKLNRRQEAV